MKEKVIQVDLPVGDIARMEYVGGGYFRLPAAKGQSSPIIHAPEMRRVLFDEIKRLQGEIDTLHKLMDCAD